MGIKKYLSYLAIFLLLFVPLFVSAAIVQGSFGGLVGIIDDLANWLYIIGFGIALIVIIVSGIMYMTAGGNEDSVAKAKKTIITGLIGTAIMILSGVVLDTIANILGVTPP